jgi:hypothetical protein
MKPSTIGCSFLWSFLNVRLGDDAIEMHIFIAHTRRRDITDEIIENLRNGVLSQNGNYVSGPIFGDVQ